jgi:nitronate monooxygenase
MWPRTDFLELLGITHPVIQAPMAGFAPPALAAAVCNAGGLGSIGCAGIPPATVRGQITALRQATNRPYNLNFFVHSHPRLDPDAAARMRTRLTPYFDDLGWDRSLSPQSRFHPSTKNGSTSFSSCGLRSSAFTLACRTQPQFGE